MPFSGFAFLFICPLCGQPLEITGIEKPNDTDILVSGRCSRCGENMTVHTTFERTIEQILDALGGEDASQRRN